MTRQLHSPAEIVLIDDEDDFRLSFIMDASKRRLIVKGFNNLHSALEHLEESDRTMFVILDAKCFIKEGQIKGSEDTNFLISAPFKINEIARIKNRVLPFCVYSGFAENIGNMDGICKVFVKGKDSDLLFDHIIENILNNEIYNIEHAFKPYFDGLRESNFTSEFISEFTNACLRVQKLKSNTSKSIIRDFRPLLEGIYVHFNESFPSVLNATFFNRNEVNLNGITKRMGGNRKFDAQTQKLVFESSQIMPNHIYELANFLKNSTSETSMHYHEGSISKNFVQMLFHAMLEIVNWYTDYYKEKHTSAGH